MPRIWNWGRKKNVIYKHGSSTFFTMVEHPLQGATKEELAKIRVELGAAARVKLDAAMAGLQKLLPETSPLPLLANVSLYALTTGIAADGTKSPTGITAQQAHIELLQALALRIPANEYKGLDYDPGQTQDVYDLLEKMVEGYLMLGVDGMPAGADEKEMEVYSLLKRLRTHTFGVRNWGYFNDVNDIVTRLVAPLDQDIKRLSGISGTELAGLINGVVREMERRANARRQRLIPMLSSKRLVDAVTAYYKEYDLPADDVGDFVSLMRKRGASLEAAKMMLVSHSDRMNGEMCIYSTEVMAGFAGPAVDSKDMRRFLSGISLTFGDLAGTEIDRLFLANPVWNKPVIRVGEDRWFIPIPAMLSSFVFTLLDDIFKTDVAARAKYHHRRAKFLEQDVVSTLTSVLKGAESYTNVCWKDPDSGKGYETDLVLDYEGIIILAESKSHKTTQEALRGAPDRVRKKISEIIEKPSIQSARLATLLQERRHELRLEDKRGQPIPINLATRRKVIRLSVILEDFGTLQASARGLMDAGLLTKGVELAPTMLLSDLKVVCDILDTPGVLLHYLWRRGHFSKTAKFFGDELDLLAMYLDTGFEIGDAEYNDIQINVMMMSQRLNKYYEAKDAGHSPPKPGRELTKWWRDLIAYVEQRRLRHWCETAIALLCVSLDSQVRMKTHLWKLKMRHRLRWLMLRFINTYSAVVGPRGEQFGLALLVFSKRTAKDRKAMAQNAAWTAIGDSKARLAVVIAQNVDSDDYPYSLLVTMEPGDRGGHDAATV